MCRICNLKDRMLWARSIQWDWTLHTTLQLVPEQRNICILGPIPSIREGQQDHSAAYHDWLNQVHAPHESHHHHGHGLLGSMALDYSRFLVFLSSISIYFECMLCFVCLVLFQFYDFE